MNRVEIAYLLGWPKPPKDSDLLDRVESVVKRAILAEREACVQICERIEQDKWGVLNGRSIPGQCSTAIRCGLFHAELEKEKGQE